MKSKIITIIIGIILLVSMISIVSALTVESVSSNPSEIKPGEKVRVSLVIENNLNADTEDVTVSLDLNNVPFAPYLSSNEVTFDDINEDKDKEARFELIADADSDSGTYKIPVKITYYVEDELKSSEGLISLIISAEPEIDLSADGGVLIKGQNAELTIKIVNSGLGDAGLLSLKIGTGIGIRVIGNDKMYIGDVDSDDFDSVDFKVSISENAPSTVNLPVEIKYRDSRNKEIIENINLDLITYTTKQAQNLGLIKKSNTTSIVIGIVFILILYIIYRKIRKARRNKKKEE